MRTELSPSMDLSEFAYEEARSAVLKDIPRTESKYRLVRLAVSLWDVDEAIAVMAKYRNCEVLISPSYKMDEWSLSYGGHEIHSEGA